jgi:hypothetical protein
MVMVLLVCLVTSAVFPAVASANTLWAGIMDQVEDLVEVLP